MIHLYEARLYGTRLPKKRRRELDTRKVAPMLSRIYELDNRPLTIERPPNKRLVGNCRDFATMLCAILRQQGMPARVRCGFAIYFEPDFYTDHVVCEYWKSEEQRWVLVDAQVDDAQRWAYQIKVDTYDLTLLDRVAAMSLADNNAFPDLRALYLNDAHLRVPHVIKSYTQTGVQMVDLTTD